MVGAVQAEDHEGYRRFCDIREGAMTDQQQRESQAKKIAGNDQMLYRRIMKYGIHKYIPIKPESECFICDRAKESPIHGVKN